MAYALLSDTTKATIAPLKVRMSMRDVLAAAQAVMEPNDSPLGRLAASRHARQLDEAIRRKVEGSAHPLVRTHRVRKRSTAGKILKIP